jgi:antitoxin MazE
MKSIVTTLRQIGNSRGVVIPRLILEQLDFVQKSEIRLSVKGDALVLRKAPNRVSVVRKGWAEAAQAIAMDGEDELVMGEFANADDMALVW